jgi:hypothetical protein
MLLVWSAAALAGVWVREPGSAWVQLGGSYSASDQLFLPDGSRVALASEPIVGPLSGVFDHGATHVVEIAAYAEVGVRPGVELFGTLPVRDVTTRWSFARGQAEDLALRNTGFGDVALGIRAGGAIGGPVVASGAASIRAPAYDNAPARLGREAGNADLYDDRPPLGPGTVDLELLGALGVGGSVGWVQVEAGVRLRDCAYAPAIPGRLQAGWRTHRSFAVFAELEGLATLPGGRQARFFRDAYGKSPLVPDGAQRLAPGIGLHLTPFPEGALAPAGLLVRGSTVAVGALTSADDRIAAAFTWEVP